MAAAVSTTPAESTATALPRRPAGAPTGKEIAHYGRLGIQGAARLAAAHSPIGPTLGTDVFRNTKPATILLAVAIAGLAAHVAYALVSPHVGLNRHFSDWAFYGLALLVLAAGVARAGLVAARAPGMERRGRRLRRVVHGLRLLRNRRRRREGPLCLSGSRRPAAAVRRGRGGDRRAAPAFAGEALSADAAARRSDRRAGERRGLRRGDGRDLPPRSRGKQRRDHAEGCVSTWRGGAARVRRLGRGGHGLAPQPHLDRRVAGLLLAGISSTAFLLETVSGSYSAGTIVDSLWLAGGLVLAYAAWQPSGGAMPIPPGAAPARRHLGGGGRRARGPAAGPAALHRFRRGGAGGGCPDPPDLPRRCVVQGVAADVHARPHRGADRRAHHARQPAQADDRPAPRAALRRASRRRASSCCSTSTDSSATTTPTAIPAGDVLLARLGGNLERGGQARTARPTGSAATSSACS